MPVDSPRFNLEPRMVARYLTNQGWSVSKTKSNLQRIFFPEATDSLPVEIFLDYDKSSFSRGIDLAITTISEFYEKPAIDIVAEIRALAYDVISSRIPDEYVRNETIQLKIASEYIDKMRSLLAISASTELIGARFFKRTLKEASDYSETCRFGHTFRGSFGFQIESPLGLNNSPDLFDDTAERPFGRTVIERMARGMLALEKAALADDPGIIINENNDLSANMCDALVSLIEDVGVAKIDMTVRFSPEWRTEFVSRMAEVSLKEKHIDILRTASKALRVDDPPRAANIVGRVKRLESEGNPADLLQEGAKREIEVSWVNEEDVLIHVKLTLSPEAYLDAVDAHKEGQPVMAEGTLVKTGRTWRLDELKQFRVLK